MTTASYGFPFQGKVFHPTLGYRDVRELVSEITHADVASVKPHEGADDKDETSESTTSSLPAISMRGLARRSENRFSDFLCMDSPSKGYLPGVRGPVTWTRLPVNHHHHGPEQSWVKSLWTYMGQDSGRDMKGGVHGSPIWNEEAKVVGFFRYLVSEGPMKDWALSVCAEQIMDMGY